MWWILSSVALLEEKWHLKAAWMQKKGHLKVADRIKPKHIEHHEVMWGPPLELKMFQLEWKFVFYVKKKTGAKKKNCLFSDPFSSTVLAVTFSYCVNLCYNNFVTFPNKHQTTQRWRLGETTPLNSAFVKTCLFQSNPLVKIYKNVVVNWKVEWSWSLVHYKKTHLALFTHTVQTVRELPEAF